MIPKIISPTIIVQCFLITHNHAIKAVYIGHAHIKRRVITI